MTDDVLRLCKTDAFHIFRMGIGTSHRVHLYDADDTNLDAVDIEHLCGYDVKTSLW